MSPSIPGKSLPFATAAAGLIVVAVGTAAQAQVGHTPATSPYRDVPFKQEMTSFAGWFSGSRGSAGVGPQAGPIAGARYELRVGGPVYLTTRAAYVHSRRDVFDPSQPVATRRVGSKDVPLLLADVGLSINLTGQKSYRGLVPVIAFGAGVASDVGGRQDPAQFKIGTPFALSLGTGIRWVPGGTWQLRADLTDFLFRLSYPRSYQDAPTGGGAPILAPGKNLSEWRHTAALTLGVSYLFSR